MNRQFDNLRLGSIELFCLTAQHQGFTAAAKATGLTAAAVSRSVARLEERLGVRLLMRTTRQVRLTEVGQRYYDQCRNALMYCEKRVVIGSKFGRCGVGQKKILEPVDAEFVDATFGLAENAREGVAHDAVDP